MRVATINGPGEVEGDGRGRAVTIGAFDGVHLGHQALIRFVHDLAQARGLSATVLTFDRHPAEVVRPEAAPRLLTTLDQKLELLAALGALDEAVVLEFDAARSREPAEQFVESVLAAALHTRLVVVGADFHFGRGRHGDVPLLQRMGVELGFEVLGLGLVASPDGSSAAAGSLPYSSTRARTLLAAGDVEGAAAILGRPHAVRGTVELDEGRPWLIVPNRVCLPAPGAYRSDAGVAVVADDEAAPARRVRLDVVADGDVRFLAPA